MASSTTSVFSTRVQNSTATQLKRTATDNGLTPAQLLDVIAGGLENGEIQIEGGEIVADSLVIPQPLVMDDDFTYLHLDKLVRTFRDKKYPDRVIQENIDRIIDMVRENRDYNPKRARDWGAC